MRLALAAPICLVIAWIRPRWIRWNGIVVYFASVALLAMVLLYGSVIKGARRWIGIGEYRFQPSDLAKIALCVALGHWLSSRDRAKSGWGVVVAVLLTIVPFGLILKEPDLGTALSLIPILVASLLAAGVKSRHFVILMLIAVAGLAVQGIVGLHGYQRNRVETWWRQNVLTRSEKLGQGYHLHRSKVAIGSGGIFGYGFGEGPQNKNDLLPERHTDFAFSVICEEAGFAGAIAIILLEWLIPTCLFIIAFRVRDAFVRITIVGIGAQIGAQAIINMGVTTGAFPTTGIALPLVSYGGTSAVVTLASIAIALQLALRQEPVLAGEAFSPDEEATAFDRPRRG